MNQVKESELNREPVDTAEEQMRNDQVENDQNNDNNNTRQENHTVVIEEEGFAPLFENKQATDFRTQWLEIQSRFVDDPAVSVRQADELVTHVIENITSTFADERTSLENQWNSGDKVSTEDLRMALRRYRSFFDRLLSLES
jgi:hypothetical protein